MSPVRSLSCALAACLFAGCFEDERWTEIHVVAEPGASVVGQAFGYCLYDPDDPVGTEQHGPRALLTVTAPCTPSDDQSISIPGTIVVRNASRREWTLRARFQMTTDSPTAAPCEPCPSGDLMSGQRCITSGVQQIGLSALGATPPRYSVVIGATAIRVVEVVDGLDAGVPDAGCPR